MILISLFFQLSKAREVLKWRAENVEESNRIWTSLGDINQKIFDAFQELSGISQVKN